MGLTKQGLERLWAHITNKFNTLIGDKPVSEQIEEAVEGISPADIGAQPAGDYALKTEILPAIVDVAELPETGEPDRLYRLLTGTFYFEGEPLDVFICYIVEQFPETGIPTTDAGRNQYWMYYSLETKTLMGYVDETLSAGLDVPVGWHPAETLLQHYGGIVFDPADATEWMTVYLVLDVALYEYADRWIMLNQVGWRGQGKASEIFNDRQNYAYGNYSHAEGFHTITGIVGSHLSGHYSHAEGKYSHAQGYASHAEGVGGHAEAEASHVEGNGGHAEGYASHAEGGSNHARGGYSHAEGVANYAEGYASHVEGEGGYVNLQLSGDANATVYTNNNTLPSQIYVGMPLCVERQVEVAGNAVGVTHSTAKVTAFNTTTKTITVDRTLSKTAMSNEYARGYYAGTALSGYTHVEGQMNIAAGRSQHVQGEFNDWDPNYVMGRNDDRAKYADIVGNGTSHTDRSNAYALDWNGNAYYAGNVYVAGNGKNDFAGAKKLATESSVEAVRSSIPTKVSALTNDSGYLTEHQDLTAYATKTYTDNAVSTHNTNASAHNDIRDLISGLSTRLNALADSDDTTLDQMSEIVAYIKANKGLIDSVTTSKVNTADIVNNLTTNVATKPLSAAQGVALKSLVDGKAAKSDLTGLATQDYVNAQIQAAIANLLTREQMVEYVETSILGGEW